MGTPNAPGETADVKRALGGRLLLTVGIAALMGLVMLGHYLLKLHVLDPSGVSTVWAVPGQDGGRLYVTEVVDHPDDEGTDDRESRRIAVYRLSDGAPLTRHVVVRRARGTPRLVYLGQAARGHWWYASELGLHLRDGPLAALQEDEQPWLAEAQRGTLPAGRRLDTRMRYDPKQRTVVLVGPDGGLLDVDAATRSHRPRAGPMPRHVPRPSLRSSAVELGQRRVAELRAAGVPGVHAYRVRQDRRAPAGASFVVEHSPPSKPNDTSDGAPRYLHPLFLVDERTRRPARVGPNEDLLLMHSESLRKDAAARLSAVGTESGTARWTTPLPAPRGTLSLFAVRTLGSDVLLVFRSYKDVWAVRVRGGDGGIVWQRNLAEG